MDEPVIVETPSSLASADAVMIGETMVMLVPDGGESLESAHGFSSYIGGAESNVATSLARLGASVRWASTMRPDPLGRRIAAELAEAGVDISAIVWEESDQTGLYLKDPGPLSTDVYYYRQGSTARRLGPGIWRDARLRGASILHLTGVTPALSASAMAAVEAAVIERCTGAGLVSFDVNHRLALWSVERAAPVLLRFSDAADLVFVGLDEAFRLWRCETPRSVRRLLPHAGTVVVKDGAAGAYAITPEAEVFVPSLSVDVVEPVGAGDAFAAGYLKGVLDGRDARSCLRLGHLLAATALSVRGDSADPPSEEWIEASLCLDDDEWSRGLSSLGEGRRRTG